MKATLELPQLIEVEGLEPYDFISYYENNKTAIEKGLEKNGAVKIKGVHIDTLDDFQKIVNAISNKFLNYIDGNSPRTKLTGNVYTSTEFDKTRRITMHNELSYSTKWPKKLFFSCLKPAATGGETLLADSREILNLMDKTIVGEIINKGLFYIRNLHGGLGIGPSWQETFETNDREQLENYCKSHNIQFEWKDNDHLKLIQRSKGIIPHHITREMLWFNQIDQFHPSHLGEELYEVLQSMYESETDYPMFVQFGDGTEISEDMVNEIGRTIEKVTIAPKWEKDELLIVDNELICHGRNPFTGTRRVLVSLSD